MRKQETIRAIKYYYTPVANTTEHLGKNNVLGFAMDSIREGHSLKEIVDYVQDNKDEFLHQAFAANKRHFRGVSRGLEMLEAILNNKKVS